ncbi:MAG: hypothetical protein JO246_07145 [Frankiaceae bacterium]|nr:hypothetical protein [Frankiaceae bacterium]
MPSPFHGQVALSASAQQLDTQNRECTSFAIKAPLSNSNPCYIGVSGVTTANGYQLDPGDEVTYERVIQNGQPLYQLRPGDFYAVGTAPDRVTWLASP